MLKSILKLKSKEEIFAVFSNLLIGARYRLLLNAGLLGFYEIVDFIIENFDINYDKSGCFWFLSELIRKTSYNKIHGKLLNKLEDINIENKWGENLLMHAVSYNFVDIIMIKKLLDLRICVNKKNYFGSTALMFATKYNSPEVIELLIRYGANINEIDFDNRSALDWAMMGNLKGNYNIIQNYKYETSEI